MKGAIFLSTKYGSTGEYANWISEAIGLPVFNIKDTEADLSKYDFLILGKNELVKDRRQTNNSVYRFGCFWER